MRGIEVHDKAYAYVTREAKEEFELLVFTPRDADAGVQVPKGTVEPGERPRAAVVRELHEESGLTDVEAVRPLAADSWEHPRKPKIYRRHFFHVPVTETRDTWTHTVTGDGEEVGTIYEYRWKPPTEVDLVSEMDAYLDQLP